MHFWLLTLDPFSVSKYSDVFLWAELSWRQKESPDRFTNASYEVFKLVFNNNWRNSDFTCIYKVPYCPGPLFENVNFNGRTQIGRSALKGW